MTSVRSRILFFFTLLAGASVFAIYTSGRSTRVVADASRLVVGRHLPLVHALSRMEMALLRQSNAAYRYVITGQREWLDECEKERAAYAQAFVEVQNLVTEPLERDKLADIDQLYVQYDNYVRYILLSGPVSPVTRNMLKNSDRLLLSIDANIIQLETFREGITTSQQGLIKATMARHQRVIVVSLVAIAFVFTLLAFYLWRFLVIPMSLLIDGIRNFTRGKTDVQIPAVGRDELGELREAFNEMSREIDSERRRLKNESHSDALTGLFNMRYFRGQIGEEFQRAQRYERALTLLMIDVDHFKTYNDRHGHPAGDIVLKEIARLLVRNVRGTDVVARYGGEEFVVLLPETPMESAVNVAKKILKSVEGHNFPFVGGQAAQRVTVSMGISSYPDTHVTSDRELMESADKALYSAKKNGRNQIWAVSGGQFSLVHSSKTAALQP